jgi:hypothetical protein
MRIQIIVEGNTLDITDDIETNLTFVIDDIAKFGARNTSFSKTMTLPGTAANNFVFGNLFDVSIQNGYDSGQANVGYNYNPGKAAQVFIFCDHIQILKGVIRILQINIVNGIVEYEACIFGELGGFISAIGDKLLESLDFSSYDHTLNMTTLFNSWAAVGSLPYYYGLIDYGFAWDGVNFQVSDLRPSIYCKSYLDAIFSASGYKYASAFCNGSMFKNLVIPNNSDGNYIEIQNYINRAFSGTVNITTTSKTIQFTTSTGAQYITEASGVFTYTRTIPSPLALNVTGSANVSIVNPNPFAVDITLVVEVNGIDTLVYSDLTVSAHASFTGTMSFSGVINVNTGEAIKVKLTCADAATLTTYRYTAATFTAVSPTPVKSVIAYGDSMPLNGQIPKGIKQKDFIVSLLNMFNLYITEDKDVERQLNIIPYKDFYNLNPANAVDWTNKIDYSKPITLKPMGELNAKVFKFAYKEDIKDYYSDFYLRKFGQTYGTRLYDTGLEFAEGTTETIPLFVGTPLVSVSGNNIVAPAIYSADNSGLKKAIGTPPRILFRSPANITATNTLNFKNGASVVGSSTSYPYIGHLDTPQNPTTDLCFGAPNEIYCTIVGSYPSANLFNTYWSGYVAEITNKDSKLLAASFRLTVQDIQNIDFSKLVFIGGQLYRLNKVIDFDCINDDVTKCELVNVINLL